MISGAAAAGGAAAASASAAAGSAAAAAAAVAAAEAAAMVSTVVTAVSAVAALASGAFAYKQSEDQKKQQEEYNEQLKRDAVEQYKKLDEAEHDTIYQSHVESLEAQRSYLTAKASNLLQSAATGTYGNSVSTTIADLNTGLGQSMSDITYRRDAQLSSFKSNADQVRQGASANMDRTIQMPSFVKAGASALNTFTSTRQATTGVAEAYKQSRVIKR